MVNKMKQYVCDTSVVFKRCFRSRQTRIIRRLPKVLCWISTKGTYPFVTSSNPVAGGVTIGSGVGPSKINKVVGVCKAYTSRVGMDLSQQNYSMKLAHVFIREVGREYGTTTGRPRRLVGSIAL